LIFHLSAANVMT